MRDIVTAFNKLVRSSNERMNTKRLPKKLTSCFLWKLIQYNPCFWEMLIYYGYWFMDHDTVLACNSAATAYSDRVTAKSFNLMQSLPVVIGTCKILFNILPPSFDLWPYLAIMLKQLPWSFMEKLCTDSKQYFHRRTFTVRKTTSSNVLGHNNYPK